MLSTNFRAQRKNVDRAGLLPVRAGLLPVSQPDQYAHVMANSLDRRTPRSVREAKAYQSVKYGSISAVAFVVTTVLSIAGVLSGIIPVLFLVLTILMAVRFSSVTGLRNRR